MAIETRIQEQGIEVVADDLAALVEVYRPVLSRDGVLVVTEQPPPKERDVAISFRLADGTPVIEARGLVAWSRKATADGPAGIGLHFLTISESSERLIDRLVEHLVEDGGTPFVVDDAAPPFVADAPAEPTFRFQIPAGEPEGREDLAGWLVAEQVLDAGPESVPEAPEARKAIDAIAALETIDGMDGVDGLGEVTPPPIAPGMPRRREGATDATRSAVFRLLEAVPQTVGATPVSIPESAPPVEEKAADFKTQLVSLPDLEALGREAAKTATSNAPEPAPENESEVESIGSEDPTVMIDVEDFRASLATASPFKAAAPALASALAATHVPERTEVPDAASQDPWIEAAERERQRRERRGPLLVWTIEVAVSILLALASVFRGFFG